MTCPTRSTRQGCLQLVLDRTRGLVTLTNGLNTEKRARAHIYESGLQNSMIPMEYTKCICHRYQVILNKP